MISLLEKNRWLAVFLTVLMAAEIFYFSTLQGGVGGTGVSWLPVAYHFIAFFLFSFFLFISVNHKKIKISQVVIVLVISIMYALSDEIHQIFVPFRDASIRDILIDSLGICFALIIGLIINKKRTTQQI